MKKTLAFCATLCLAMPALAQAPPAPSSTLPVRRVTLFTSGVAYTERGGTVDGDVTIPLLFRTAQINDILKSMVLIDRQGQVLPATYAARDPISHTLHSFAVDMTQSLSQQDILSRLRGTKVTVETGIKFGQTGQIMGVEQRVVTGPDGKQNNAAFLNLLTDEGFVSMRLDTVTSIRLLDERLNKEFREALTTLASTADEQKRQVTLHFAGAGKRDVRVGYVMEAPLWKMSYRLLIGGAAAEKGQKPDSKSYLQGWAMVENTSDDDWKGVQLALVSGRPVSFIQDLYQPLYLPRPTVAPDIVASPYPQTNDGSLYALSNDASLLIKRAGAEGPQGDRGPAGPGGGFGSYGGGAGGGFGGGSGGAPGFNRSKGNKGDAAKDMGVEVGSSPAESGFGDSLRESLQTQAAGQKAGELFEYTIKTPVDLARQQSALIPVVAQDIETQKVSLYNADTDARFPLNAVRVHNTTGLHLKGGPVTLFDNGVYAGDARMEDIPPGDSRLLTYAVDLAVEGERQPIAAATVETGFSLRQRTLIIKRREHTETVYTLKSRSDKPRIVLIEHPFNSEYKLIQPEKAAERTAKLYRFAVAVPAGKTESLKVVLERPLSESFGLIEGDLGTLIAYTKQKAISPKLQAALQEVITRRRKVQDLQAQGDARNADIQAINVDQERIRKNMMALDKDNPLYKRYVTTLDTQETKIEALRQEAARLHDQADAAALDLRAYLDSLSID